VMDRPPCPERTLAQIEEKLEWYEEKYFDDKSPEILKERDRLQKKVEAEKQRQHEEKQRQHEEKEREKQRQHEITIARMKYRKRLFPDEGNSSTGKFFLFFVFSSLTD